jgi:hypothetical protein
MVQLKNRPISISFKPKRPMYCDQIFRIVTRGTLKHSTNRLPENMDTIEHSHINIRKLCALPIAATVGRKAISYQLNMTPRLISGLVSMVILISASHAETVTIKSLLQEMTDRTQLAQLDDPAFTSKQFSSYDRKSVSPDDPKTWFANEDWCRFIRKETVNGRTEEVLMEADGPGAIVRWWTTMAGPNSGRGTLRIYIDGEAEPRIQGNPFDLISRGALAPSPLSESVPKGVWELRRGHNLYLPIPYSKSCKVTLEPEDEGRVWFLITTRTYPADTEVESYSEQAVHDAKDALEMAAKKLSTLDREVSPDWERKLLTGKLNPGESRKVELSGPGAVRELLVNVQAKDQEQALRSTVLKMEFDGKQTVWCPVGDFFGTGHQIAPHRAWYTEIGVDGTLGCWWVMPFERSAVITLENLGNQPVEIHHGHVATGDWDWNETSLHFHSTWRQDYRFKSGEKEAGARDYNFVTIQGQGKYVGDTLTLYNAGSMWWGEGDEKIWIDGEDFPSHFGTGTEDYYGYAWCKAEEFAHPFIAQPVGKGSGQSRDVTKHAPVVNSRWRALDAIPFNRSLQFDMEIWHQGLAWMNYAPTTFFYARPGATTNVQPDPEQARNPVPKMPEDVNPQQAKK